MQYTSKFSGEEIDSILDSVASKQDAIPDLETIRSNSKNASDTIARMVESGYLFAGIATIDTNPGIPNAKVFYIANGKGTYTNFGGLEVTEDEVVVLYWDTAWHKVATGIASQEKLSELDKEINGCEAISIVDENVPWEQKLDKKVNVSAYKGKTIKVKTSSDNIETSYTFNLYIMTDIYSSSIIETRSLHVGDSTEIEITEDINYIWLFNDYVLGTGKTLYVQIYIDGVKGVADDIVEIKESIASLNAIRIEQTETQIKVSNKNPKGNTTTIMFEPFGVNNLWQIRGVEIYDSSDNLLVKFTTDTDSVGPYQVGAVNNVDGDNIGTAVADFTGGCHGYNGDQTGSATASSSVKVNSLNGILDVVVTNRIQGYNTRKANGTGREIIVEEVHYVFESGVDGFKVNNFIKALEEVTIKLYYGMQIAFARDFVKFNSGEIGKWKGQSLNASYDGNFLDSVVGKNNNGLIQKMYVLDRGLGHFGFVPSNIPKAFQSGKIYYNLIRQNVSLEVDDTLFFEGGYIFDYVGSPVILGGYYDYQNERINSFIPRGILQTKRYRINIFIAGENMPYNINVYLSSGKFSSDIITTYTNITSGSSIEIELTDAVEYIWLFSSENSTGRINYTITEI